MACESVTLPGGTRAIVCGTRRRQRCACGAVATKLCDWKAATKSGTCDAPLCARCSTAPAPDKDLCLTHAIAFDEWKARRAIASASSGDAPVCAALTEPDAPTVPAAGVSAPQGRSSNPALAAAKPETAHV
jgi:hypothetical protein